MRSSLIVYNFPYNFPVHTARFFNLFHGDLTPRLRAFIRSHKTASQCHCSGDHHCFVRIINHFSNRPSGSSSCHEDNVINACFHSSSIHTSSEPGRIPNTPSVFSGPGSWCVGLANTRSCARTHRHHSYALIICSTDQNHGVDCIS